MIEPRVQYALDNFLLPDYVAPVSVSYDLYEKEKNGESKLHLDVGTTDNICVKNYDQLPRCAFLRKERQFHMRQCIDHLILRKVDSHWEAHMIEMKTTVGRDTWLNIKYKVRASYLNAYAMAVFLGIALDDEHIFTYTTYEHDHMDVAHNENPRLISANMGVPVYDIKKDEWDANRLYFSITELADIAHKVCLQHRKVKMFRKNEAGPLEGILNLT